MVLDKKFKNKSYKIERRRHHAILTGEGTLEEHMPNTLSRKNPNYHNDDLPGNRIISGFENASISGALLTRLLEIGEAYYANELINPDEITQEMISLSKKVVGELLHTDLSDVDVALVPGGCDEGEGNLEGIVQPFGQKAPLVVMPQPCPRGEERLVTLLVRAAHLIKRREDGDPAKIYADPASESFVEYAVLTPYLEGAWGESAFAASMMPLVDCLYARAMMEFQIDHGRLPEDSSELLASMPGDPLSQMDNYEHFELIHEYFESDHMQIQVEMRRGAGILLALGLCSWPEKLTEYMRNDTLALTIDEKILRTFNVHPNNHFDRAEEMLRHRLEMARRTDAERIGSIPH